MSAASSSSSPSGKPLVLVTGASGYIGAHVVRQLLDSGKYRVRGTVRDPTSDKCAFLRLWSGDKSHDVGQKGDDGGSAAGSGADSSSHNAATDLELVAADLRDQAAWDAAAAGCDYVCHVASPFIIGVKPDEAEEKLYKPARDGTRTVLLAALKAGTVKRVVVTSSMAAMLGGRGHFERVDDPEKEWGNDTADPYSYSKVLAEHAAWDFVKEHAEETGAFDLAVINPTLVVGPPLSNAWATSHELPQKILMRSMPAVPDLKFGVVDVRDVARAHILALETPEAAGHRFACWAQVMPVQRIAEIYAKEFGPLGYNPPTRHLPKILMWIASFFDPALGAIVSQVGKPATLVNNSAAREILGIEFADADKTLLDHAHACVSLGVKGFDMTPEYQKMLSGFGATAGARASDIKLAPA